LEFTILASLENFLWNYTVKFWGEIAFFVPIGGGLEGNFGEEVCPLPFLPHTKFFCVKQDSFGVSPLFV